jgi:hypothetical protein
MTNEELETWKNQARGNVVVKKRGEYGIEVDEMVRGGKALHITTADRKMNQERAASSDLDVFTNGMLAPVKVGEAAAEFAQNPNLMTEDDMVKLVTAHPKTFDKRLAEITNPVIVSRILEIANEQDCSIKRVEAIQARLEDTSPINTVKIQSHAPDERAVTTFKN